MGSDGRQLSSSCLAQPAASVTAVRHDDPSRRACGTPQGLPSPVCGGIRLRVGECRLGFSGCPGHRRHWFVAADEEVGHRTRADCSATRPDPRANDGPASGDPAAIQASALVSLGLVRERRCPGRRLRDFTGQWTIFSPGRAGPMTGMSAPVTTLAGHRAGIFPARAGTTGAVSVRIDTTAHADTMISCSIAS
jgi:hypothetical protein